MDIFESNAPLGDDKNVFHETLIEEPTSDSPGTTVKVARLTRRTEMMNNSFACLAVGVRTLVAEDWIVGDNSDGRSAWVVGDLNLRSPDDRVSMLFDEHTFPFHWQGSKRPGGRSVSSYSVITRQAQ